MVCLIPIVCAMIPVSNAYTVTHTRILGDTHIVEHGGGFNRVRWTWSINEPCPGIDIFIFTEPQYLVWELNPDQDPVLYIKKGYFTTSGAQDLMIRESDNYTIVFSNEHGGSTVEGVFTVTWWNAVLPGFNRNWLIIILAVISGIAIALNIYLMLKVRRLETKSDSAKIEKNGSINCAPGTHVSHSNQHVKTV